MDADPDADLDPHAHADPDPDLARLAAGHGVATSYEDWSGRAVAVRPEAVVAALGALGVAADSPAAVAAALADLEQAPWRRLLPPSLVVRVGSAPVVAVRGPAGVDVALTVLTEDGERVDVEVAGPATQTRDGRERRDVRLPDLPLGWHRLQAAAGAERDEVTLVVAPSHVARPAGPARSWGWMVQLYALRSAGSWCVGDYADLATVVTHTRKAGGGVVLVNPLHAETPLLPVTPSPYSPSSRRFRSPLWLRVADVPEYEVAGQDVRDLIAALRPRTDPERVERDPAWRAKLAALELLWPLHRADALAAFRAELGESLEGFALFCALSERHGRPWQDWPEDLRRPDGAGVEAARTELSERVSFWCWLQLLVDEQLIAVTAATGARATTGGVAAGGAAEVGMSIGVVHDLAVGVDAGGADAWALQDALALRTTVGAPPDSFNQQGQDWGLPPWRPDRLRELGYEPFRELVRGVLRHAGGIRIDHVMGLFRLWWVPQGASAAQGTYVSYDAEAMLGILALEATRAGALVVGEDLGTVEDRVRTALDKVGILGSAVLWFERDIEDGHFLAPETWREQAMASVTTHDLPTAAGFLTQEHVRVRHELGQLGVPVEQERAKAREDRAALVAALERDGLLAPGADDEAIVLAMHAALARSPSRLVLASPGDAVGDLRQPNLPGTVDQYPNWRLPVADGSGRPLALEELLAHSGMTRLAGLLADGLAPGAVGSARKGTDRPARTRADRTVTDTQKTDTPVTVTSKSDTQKTDDQTDPVRTS